MAQSLFKVCVVSGVIMMICLVALCCYPCAGTLILFLIAKLTCIISGLWSNAVDKEGGHDNGKYNG